MPQIYPKTYFGDKIIAIEDSNVSIASSAVLYGLSIYTVFPIVISKDGPAAFRLKDHFNRLINSAKIIGINTFEKAWTYDRFEEVIKELALANNITTDAFVRATVHVTELLPGTKSRRLETKLSIFIYEAKTIIPQDGARLKVSPYERVSNSAIPPRAKVNGAYVNSVLGKQNAIDDGYDDCLFLNQKGYVSELSAANIFYIKNNVLITPDTDSDILEGITRKTILELVKEMGIETIEKKVSLNELLEADEVFACGTSSFIAPIIQIDTQKIITGKIGSITQKIKEKYIQTLNSSSQHLTLLQ